LGILWPAAGASFLQAQAEHAARPALAVPLMRAPAAVQWRLPAHWEPQGLPPPVRPARLELSLREIAIEPEYLWVGLSARAVGTIVHAELQRLAQRSYLPPTPEAAPSTYQGWLTELGVAPAERPRAGERVHQAIAQTLRDPRGRWLLGPEHREAHSEWRLTGQHEGRIVNVIIDRMLVDAQGERWLVDYKTSSHEGSDLEGFLAQEAERYGPQLRRYAALVAAATPGPVRIALYFPLLSEFRELPLEPVAGGAS
jgi:hypothetical protein